jgi:hypothetical protein
MTGDDLAQLRPAKARGKSIWRRSPHRDAPNVVGDHGRKDQFRWSPPPGATYKGIRVAAVETERIPSARASGFKGIDHYAITPHDAIQVPT